MALTDIAITSSRSRDVRHNLRMLTLMLAFSSGAVAAEGDACSSLRSASFSQTRIVSAEVVAANAGAALPAFCEVQAIVAPVENSKIGVVYRLPERWNGKVLGLGGGGWAGNVQLNTAAPGLKAGYATAQTDTGHPLPARFEEVWRPDLWSSNPEAVIDFQHRAIHVMTTVGKEVVANYYGRPHTKAYFQGCSTGGRQGLMEVQRYPDDYDGVVAMAPVYNLTVQTSAVVRDNILGGAAVPLNAAQLNKVNAAVIKACDARDGLADGLLADPRECTWNPAAMQCASGQSGDTCLTPAQVDAVHALYRGVQTKDGRFVAWPLSRGGESGWERFAGLSGISSDSTHAGGLGKLLGPVLGDPAFDLSRFQANKHFDMVRDSAFAKGYEANDANIAGFFKRGGKLLLWHGWNDAGPSPWLTIDYFERVTKTVPSASSNVRLFLSPGVEHCAGGPGLDKFDALAALDSWVQSGKAPNVLLTTKDKPKMSRPICAYPVLPRYKGGEPSDAASFECK
jgi:feruloyl esterase